MNEQKLIKLEKRKALKETLYRRRYLIPNLVTVGNMFCGYLAIMYSVTGAFDKAVIAITIAILLDGLDGRVARKLNATSKFGMEFDSFSDVVSFGVAPGILMYEWGFKTVADEFGILISFLYTLCAASRLARFNLADENLKSFSGLPTPASAGAVLSLIYLIGPMHPAIVESEYLIPSLGCLLLLTLAYLMISRVEFMSVKSIKLQGLGLSAMILVGLVIATIWYSARFGFFAVAMIYCFSGPIKSIRKSWA